MIAMLYLLIWLVVTAALAWRGGSNARVLASMLAGIVPVLVAAVVLDMRGPDSGAHAQLAHGNVIAAGVLCGFFVVVAATAVFIVRRARRDD